MASFFHAMFKTWNWIKWTIWSYFIIPFGCYIHNKEMSAYCKHAMQLSWKILITSIMWNLMHDNLGKFPLAVLAPHNFYFDIMRAEISKHRRWWIWSHVHLTAIHSIWLFETFCRFLLWCVLRMVASLDSIAQVFFVNHGFLMDTQWFYLLTGVALKQLSQSMCWGMYYGLMLLNLINVENH